MKLKNVVPKIEQFGKLEIAGDIEETRRRVNGQQRVVSRAYHLYSDKILTEEIKVTLPGTVPAKEFPVGTMVRLMKPTIVAKGNDVNGNGYIEYELEAADMITERR